MEFEEFQESDVMFSFDHLWDQKIHQNKGFSLPRNDKNKKKHQQQQSQSMMISSSPRSLPVNIPASMDFLRRNIDVAGREWSDQSSDEDQDDFDDDDEIMGRLPPHMIVERRVSGEIARSFSPLKGRNLCQVRNNILRMTGFLER